MLPLSFFLLSFSPFSHLLASAKLEGLNFSRRTKDPNMPLGLVGLFLSTGIRVLSSMSIDLNAFFFDTIDLHASVSAKSFFSSCAIFITRHLLRAFTSHM